MNSSVRSLRSEKQPETSTRTAATFEALRKERWMTKPENHHERVSETEQVLEHLIFFTKQDKSKVLKQFQKHRSKMICETVTFFLLNIAIKKAKKNVLIFYITF